ncbi:MAG: hypothetical protein ACREBG_05300 [Pyrinomonadaceae bacterium]
MNFIRSLWREGAPILRHGIVTASIALVAAGLLRLSETILPQDYFDVFRRVDHILFVVLCWMFGSYTVTFLLVLLSKSVYSIALNGPGSEAMSNQSLHHGSDQAALPPGDQTSAEKTRSIVPEKIPLLREDAKS